MSSLLSSVFGAFQALAQNIEAYPLVVMRFLVPVLIIFIITLSIQRLSRKAVVNSTPTLEQKREQFIIPADFFNKEVDHISSEDFEYYIKPMDKQFGIMKDYSDTFRRLLKAYRKYDALSNSSYKRRKKRGEEWRKQTFNEILDLYANIRRMKFTVVEVENVKDKERRI